MHIPSSYELVFFSGIEIGRRPWEGIGAGRDDKMVC